MVRNGLRVDVRAVACARRRRRGRDRRQQRGATRDRRRFGASVTRIAPSLSRGARHPEPPRPAPTTSAGLGRRLCWRACRADQLVIVPRLDDLALVDDRGDVSGPSRPRRSGFGRQHLRSALLPNSLIRRASRGCRPGRARFIGRRGSSAPAREQCTRDAEALAHASRVGLAFVFGCEVRPTARVRRRSPARGRSRAAGN